ncbi:MAG: hypothetical protein H8E72_09220 [Candidatus Marinimicrobia bacterium]|nr:hypothetical protein [Candidatus Neomarinimicrobiota bacterium]
MDWASLVGAASLGAIIIRILDITWFQKVIDNSEHRKWLRTQKMIAFSELSEILLSIGIAKKYNINHNPYEFLTIASKSILLIDNNELQDKIFSFIKYWDKMLNENIPENEITELYYLLAEEGKMLLQELRIDLNKR